MKNSYISSFKTQQVYRFKWIYFTVFILLFLFSFLCLEKINRDFIITDTISFRTLEDFEKAKESVEILFLGDSHFQHGIDPQLFSYNTFNLSFPGANYIESYYLLKNYLEYMPSLKILVLPVDLHSFSSFRTDRFYNYYLNKYIDFPELVKYKRTKALSMKIETITILSTRHGRYNFVNSCISRIVRIEKLRLFKIKKEDKKPEPKMLKRVNRHLKGANVFDEDLLIYFEKILKLCKNNNITVVTIQMPVHNKYIEYSKAYIDVYDLKSKYIENPPYKKCIYKNIDYLHYYQERNDVFLDADHLNTKGIISFSEIIANELTEIMQEIMAE